MNLNQWRDEIHKNAVEHGWWDEPRTFGEIIALFHSELSEALEEYRKGQKPHEIYANYVGEKNVYKLEYGDVIQTAGYKPEGIPIELADCIIRILDYCGKEGIDIEEAVRIKHEYNKTRPYRHGGKKI